MSALATVVPAVKQAVELDAHFMPVMNIQRAVQRYNAIVEFAKEIMKPGKDFGEIPGTAKPTLLKPGAEKLCSFFGLSPKFMLVSSTEAWEGEAPFFYYFYKCQLWRGEYLMGEGDGSCNSHESKYRYRWVQEDALPSGMDRSQLVKRGGRLFEPDFAINKAETAGKYGKPAEYWQRFLDAIDKGVAVRQNKKMGKGDFVGWEIDSTLYRLPNPDVADQVNTIQKMAQKRAFIAATLIACNASEYYTQDLEDLDTINVHSVSMPPEYEESGSAEAAQEVAQRKIREKKQSQAVAINTSLPMICAAPDMSEERDDLIDAVKAELNRLAPKFDPSDMAALADARKQTAALQQEAFGVPSWKAITNLPLEGMRAGLAFLKAKANTTAEDSLEPIWSDPYKMLTSFAEQKKRLGESYYYAILKNHKAESSKDFMKDLPAAMRCFVELRSYQPETE